MTRLDEIEARANAATDGPWEAGERCVFTLDGAPVVSDDVVHYVHGMAGEGVCHGEDAEFIAHARTDVPALVSVARYALSQHAPDGHGNCGPCDDATGEDGWPCSTVREIHRLLGEDV